jgi:hypothetical protein
MILESRLKSKRFFDPRSKKDMSIVKKFVAEQTWVQMAVHFIWSFLTVQFQI